MTERTLDPSKSLRCETCYYVMPSYSANTGLRCGLKYFHSTPFMRKLQRMDHYPEVKPLNACESWKDKNEA